MRATKITDERGSGVAIARESVFNRFYTTQRTPDLSVGFTNLAERIPATPPENVFVDTSATDATKFFYRIKSE